VDLLEPWAQRGISTTADSLAAVQDARRVVICVRPEQLDPLLTQIAPAVQLDHVLISTVSGVSIRQIRERLGIAVPVIRAMPTVAVAVRESMTCLATDDDAPEGAVAAAQELFGMLGPTLVVREEQITPATALCACGVAFFLRAIRAASQGGVQVGFHADEAIRLAAQTARGAATLLLADGAVHPETVIDSVTTPLGVTIAGLNEMEHNGFSSAMIRGIVVAAEKASGLYADG
jgi:pyrroline-5-carboxylate reductase